MKTVRGKLNSSDRKICIVVSRWNELVTKELLEGALAELANFGEASIEIIHVPGTWEMPLACQKALSKEKKPDAIIALGCIIQGETTHGRLLGSDVSSALMNLQLQYKTPIAYGVLTPDTIEQALDRAGMKHGNKGREAALAALEMISVLGQL